MEIIIAFLFGFGIYFFFRIIERYFSRYYFYFSDLVIGNFSKTNLILSIITPLFFGLLVSLLTKTPSLIIFALPGFIGALLTVWPSVARSELLPYSGRVNKFSIYTSYLLFTISFTAFSSLGGILGKYFSFDSLAPSRQGLIDGIWTAVLIGIFPLLIRWAKK